MGSKVRVSSSWVTFQPLREEITKYCIASSVYNLSFHNPFDLVYDEVQDELNTWAEHVYLAKWQRAQNNEVHNIELNLAWGA